MGHFAFLWILKQGFYAIMLPSALVGLAAGYVVRSRSHLLAIMCAIGGLALGFYTEWKSLPFRADNSLSFFVKHIHELKPITLLMLAVGTVASYRFALGTDQTQPED